MMELADVPDSKSGGSDTVRVRPPSPAPEKRQVSTETCRFSMKRSLREHDDATLMMSLR